ncbi:MAG: tetratricopeptide repeat protein [Clostridium butyricum]|nr:tetratricopeptide repeat protein [Clostridium butyricum]
MKKDNNHNKNADISKKSMNSFLYILIYLSIAMGITVGVKIFMQGEEPVSIANNSAEALVYEGNYDNAILEYEKLQEKEQWPAYSIEIAKVYSLQGDFIKSNELLKNIYETRNKIIDSDGKEKHEEDKNLLNDILFTSMINGDYQKALEYGEVFLTEYPDDKNLISTMFMVYIINDRIESARIILNTYPTNEITSDDLIKLANMNAIIDNYDQAFTLLKEAWNMDNDNLGILDALEEIYLENKEYVMEEVNKLHDENKNEAVYKVWLAKLYSLDSETINEADKLITELDEKNIENLNVRFIKADVYKSLGKIKESKSILNDIYEEYEESYIGYYAKAVNKYNFADYESALNACKQSILLNRDYVANYSVMLPKIMDKLDQNQLEEAYLRIALQKQPYNYNLILKTAEYYSNVLKDSNKGLYYYELASKINSKDADVLYNMAIIKINTQRIDEAVELLEKAIEIDNGKSQYYRALGSVYLIQEKNELAIKAIRDAYSKDKEDILTLNNAGCYYSIVEKNISRALTNFKAAYEGIDENTTSEQRAIITDNYNRVKAIDEDSKVAFTITDFKLFY